MACRPEHTAPLRTASPIYRTVLGSVQMVTAQELPILKNLSIERLVLAPGSIREPHWLANANELAYCLNGKVLVTILDTDNEFSNFTLEAGEMFHVKSGSLHHIENTEDTDAELIIAYRNERPVDFTLQASFGAMSNAVLGNTYDLKAKAFALIPRSTSPKHIVHREGKPDIPSTAFLPDRHKFNVEGMQAPTKSINGSVKTARSQFWPALENMSMYSLRIGDEGMREPHWHPLTGEMGYVERGHARMSVLNPDGCVDTYYLKPGDVYFIPSAYPHQIEVIGDNEIHFLIFFDQPTPGDIGFRISATALSREVIAATFGVSKNRVPNFPTTTMDPLIVGRVNPVDEASPG